MKLLLERYPNKNPNIWLAKAQVSQTTVRRRTDRTPYKRDSFWIIKTDQLQGIYIYATSLFGNRLFHL